MDFFSNLFIATTPSTNFISINSKADKSRSKKLFVALSKIEENDNINGSYLLKVNPLMIPGIPVIRVDLIAYILLLTIAKKNSVNA